jgi:hypothetical protein
MELACAVADRQHADGPHLDLTPVAIEADLHRLSADVRRDDAPHHDPPAEQRKRRTAADVLQHQLDLP